MTVNPGDGAERVGELVVIVVDEVIVMVVAAGVLVVVVALLVILNVLSEIPTCHTPSVQLAFIFNR